MSQQRQNGAVKPPASSQTTTTTTTTTVESVTSEGSSQAPRILRLRGRHNANGRSVQWAEDVVDNEGLGRKSSKVCCIYHKPKAVGESSDESSSDSSSSDSDSDSDDGAARPTRRASNRDHKCDHPDHDHDHDHGGERRKRKEKRSPSPNAYEKIPKYKTSSQGKDEGMANGNTGS